MTARADRRQRAWQLRQVEGRDTASFATYERCDVFYVENWSTRLDVMILAQTVVHVMVRVVSHLVNHHSAVGHAVVATPTAMVVIRGAIESVLPSVTVCAEADLSSPAGVSPG